MKFYIIYADKEGIHSIECEDIDTANVHLTNIYTLHTKGDAGEPIVIYGTKSDFNANVTVDCKIVA